MDADVIVVGGGLAGLVATAELAAAGRKVILLDQEGEQNLGGQAFWSFGGLFFVDSPEQRRMGIKDTFDLAWQDWQGSAGFDRPEDDWARQWAEAYVHFAHGEKRAWLHQQGMRWFPLVGWAERGGGLATGHGNSVPRFHVTWGTGPGVIAPFVAKLREAAAKGLVQLKFRHRVNGFTRSGGAIDGVEGEILEPTSVARGQSSSRVATGSFALKAQAILVTSGGIGGNFDLVRKNWPERLGTPPEFLVSGVPEHVDGRMQLITEAAGGRIVNRDRMWHYVEGVRNWNPIWPNHGIRILPGPSSVWLDATGKRLPAPNFPGFDTLASLDHIMKTGHGYTWFVLSRAIIKKEFALSGSEQNPDLTNKSITGILSRLGKGLPPPVQAFMDKGADFIVDTDIKTLGRRMNELVGTTLIDPEALEREIVARDRETENGFSKDAQVIAIRGARNYRGDKLMRTAPPHRILDPAKGPLIAVKLNILTRKTLGGLQTDLDGRVLGADGLPLGNVYSAGEVAGFGGGGVHGYRSLEGTFLGGCIFSGRTAGRAAAKAVG
ncbi:FAD-binding dehydrogenase [Phreatobacter stygius]|uniref:FAD-binding dehydrogenase n=1 Tax=Phreatobacter stygius TaxID=1940610 RepID=A0A4D7AXG4_9HYPH|nr:FAD-binding dehydrogenase [Phreatobacter stygius]QCI63498.1 FAD-binding dehydrogenase [Phreatobacter stygius]